MYWIKTLQQHYVKGLPYSILPITSISTYLTAKNEMNRPFRIPYAHSIKNIVLSGCIGAITGLFYPITFPCIGTLYMYNIYTSENQSTNPLQITGKREQ
jgi:hypothetical protein